MKKYAAGIVPYILVDRIYFLLGLEKSNNLWSGFVGGSEPDETVIDTAIREFHEETALVFKDYPLKHLLETTQPIMDKTSTGKEVYIYFIKFPVDICDNIIPVFLKNKSLLPEEQFHEKSMLRWFSLDEVKNSPKIFKKIKKAITLNF
jgi:8-oxo-dGTP pyrophosphatase MutT (NUDIX family)